MKRGTPVSERFWAKVKGGDVDTPRNPMNSAGAVATGAANALRRPGPPVRRPSRTDHRQQSALTPPTTGT